MDDFLNACEEEILDIVDSSTGTECLMVKQLYRSSTTGDFCLAIRTDSVEEIYKIALALNDTQNNSEKKLKFMTYTNVGITCKFSNGKFEILDDKFIRKNEKLAFALRISADSGLLSILEKYNCSPNCPLEPIKGLFGRYEYLLNVKMKEFAEIFPVLCEKKIGFSSDSAKVYSSGVNDLENILRYPSIRNVNERVLVSVNVPSLQSGEAVHGDDLLIFRNNVIDRNKALFDRIEGLSKWHKYFSSENRAFIDLTRGMREIYKAFSAMGMEKEAYINWLVFCKDMEILCSSIEKSAEDYAKMCDDVTYIESEKRGYRIRLLEDWRTSLQSINQYTRLVQNVNYQTYQSPIYEIQTQIDTEKALVAYREAMSIYIDFYRKSSVEGSVDRVKLFPIIYPDLSKDKVEVTAPFINEALNDKNDEREIICTVPSFEYFGRLYDLLPLIIHESSHHLRILSREERNRFVIQYVFSYVFALVLEEYLPELANDIMYRENGQMERQLINSMVDVLLESMEMDENFNELGFEKMIRAIDAYMESLFLYDCDFDKQKYEYEAKKIQNTAYEFFLSEYRKEQILNKKNLIEILKIKPKEDYEEKEIQWEELAESLLEAYRVRLLGEKIDGRKYIELLDLYCDRELFEKKLIAVKENWKDRVSKDGIREYAYNVIRVYRVLSERCEYGNDKRTSEAEGYLEKVFDKCSTKMLEQPEVILDPSAMNVLRRLGFLDADRELFCKTILDAFKNVSGSSVKMHKRIRVRIYRESFADLLMATSLGLNAFGYCRQVLQVISDARIAENEYYYDDMDRFRIVTAVLLAEQGENDDSILKENETPEMLFVKGDMLIEKGIEYCEYSLKCIRDKLLGEIETEKDSLGRKKANVIDFIGRIYEQVKILLENRQSPECMNCTFLYILLYGEEGVPSEVIMEWKSFNMREECEPYKYLFWRVEYFCEGLMHILQNGHIVVSRDIFNHMYQVRKQIVKESKDGCAWEKACRCLLEPKADVGKFYNEPKLVYEKTSQQKLENTIDFIQNYYYFNRFEVMEKGEYCGTDKG